MFRATLNKQVVDPVPPVPFSKMMIVFFFPGSVNRHRDDQNDVVTRGT